MVLCRAKNRGQGHSHSIFRFVWCQPNSDRIRKSDIVIPVILAQLLRKSLLTKGTAAFDAAMAKIGPWSISALLATLVLLFTFQGEAILRDAEISNIPFFNGTDGRIASFPFAYVARHTALRVPHTASRQHRQKRHIGCFRIP